MTVYGFKDNKCKEEIAEEIAVSSSEPTANEKVWIDNESKRMYVKNNNGEFEEFPSVKKVSVNEFFTSTNYTVTEFEAYQFGNVFNIQRMIINNVGAITSETKVGEVSSKYAPKGGMPIRVHGGSGGATFDFLCFINSEVFNIIRNQTIAINGKNVYVYNVSYIIN